jgi:hypothetical protein
MRIFLDSILKFYEQSAYDFCYKPAAFPAKGGYLSKPALAGLLLLLLFQNAYGLEAPDSAREFGAELKLQYNLGFAYCTDFSVFGFLECNRFLLLGGGISAERIGNVFVINSFLSCRFSLPFYTPLNVRLVGLYNGLPEYKTNIHTILPLAGLEWKYFGFSAGASLRFTGFWDDILLFEILPAYSVHVMFINFKKVQAGIEWANFSDYESGNLGSYVYRLKSRIRITDRLAVTSNFEILISGSISRIISVYGYAYKGGIIYSW